MSTPNISTNKSSHDLANNTQLLTLKVMRLSKPSFHMNSMYTQLQPEMSEITSRSMYNEETIQNINNENWFSTFDQTDILTLPTSFGNIYVGETFKSYISINNNSNIDVKDVIIKAELQASTQRYGLLENNSNIPLFEAGDSKDFIVSHNITESGPHILVCSANYIIKDGEKKYFRKLFKFNVDQPFSINTNNSTLINDELFLEILIRNQTKTNLFLEKIIFESLVGLTVEDLNINNRQDCPVQTSDELASLILLKPGKSRQQIYKIIGDPQNTQNGVGYLHVHWNGNLGGSGKTKSGLIEKKKNKDKYYFKLLTSNIPPKINIEVPFTITLTVINKTDKIVNPRLYFNDIKMQKGGVLFLGISGKEIGRLKPKQSTFIDINLLPIKYGFTSFTGVSLIDHPQDIKFSIDNICNLFIEQ
eukprot:TRINITY_DN1161_c0_g1_i1.p1 TRINITY_DN1161_c0_g1~~TRINITY_DN1161_c0_g1_i1.p1  ORF type:complete len:419 (+),score=92.98 TRINITY_DN1161_c0_g1_i1:47-1303(+)